MVFRPFPILTAFTLPALAFLIWLGSWQLDRRAWKAELIAQYQLNAAAPAETLGNLLCRGEGPATGLSVRTDGLGLEEASVKVYGTGPDGTPGWRVFQAAPLPACEVYAFILVESRFEPLETARRGPDGRVAGVSTPERLRLETPLMAGLFTPVSNEASGEFYAFDADAMAQALSIGTGGLHQAYWIAGHDGALPAYLSATPPERHVGYAVTWFLMALALLGVYALFHMRAGRLRVGG